MSFIPCPGSKTNSIPCGIYLVILRRDWFSIKGKNTMEKKGHKWATSSQTMKTWSHFNSCAQLFGHNAFAVLFFSTFVAAC